MSETRVKNDNFVNIQGWMVNELHLKGNELLVYGIIYGFSQAEQQKFTGSLQYLADWTNSSKSGIQKNLKSLVEKGFLIKEDNVVNGVKFCSYYTTELDEVCNKVTQGMQQSCIGYTTELYRGMQQSGTNNINNNKKENIEDIKEDNKKRDGRTKVYFPLDEMLDETFKDFLEMRKKMRKAMTDKAVNLAISKLEKLSADMFGNMDNDKAIEIINQSIEHGWLTFYPLKEEKTGKKASGYDWDNL